MIYYYFLFSILFIISISIIDGLDPEVLNNVCFKSYINNNFSRPENWKSYFGEKKITLKIPIDPSVNEIVAYCNDYNKNTKECNSYYAKDCCNEDCLSTGVCDCQKPIFVKKIRIEISGPLFKLGLNNNSFPFDCDCLTSPNCNKNYLNCSCESGQAYEILGASYHFCMCKKLKCHTFMIKKNCKILCSNGTFDRCTRECLCNKKNSIECIKKTGDCLCKPSFYGQYCENHCKGELVCKSSFDCKCYVSNRFISLTFFLIGSIGLLILMVSKF